MVVHGDGPAQGRGGHPVEVRVGGEVPPAAGAAREGAVAGAHHGGLGHGWGRSGWGLANFRKWTLMIFKSYLN